MKSNCIHLVLGDSGNDPTKGSTASYSYDGDSREHTKAFSEHIFPVTTYDFEVKLIDPMPFELITSEGTYENIPDMQSKAATVKCYTKPSKLSGKVKIKAKISCSTWRPFCNIMSGA